MKSNAFVVVLFIALSEFGSHCSNIPEAANKNGNNDLYNFRCFHENDVDHYQNFSWKHQKIVGLQVSARATHQLITRIFAIFLREVFAYENIKLMPVQRKGEIESIYTYRILNNLVGPYNIWWEPILDLEVWVSPDAFRTRVPRVNYAGFVTDPGRFGLFVPAQLLTNHSNSFTMLNIMHYSTFMKPTSEYYQQFVIDGNVLKQLQEKFGIQQNFTANRCYSMHCVTVLSEHYNDTSFVESHIQELNMYLNVIWLGDNLQAAITWLLNSYYRSDSIRTNSKFIVLHWTPSNIIDGGIEFKSIMMPPCDELRSTQRTSCKYQMTPLLKYYSQKLHDESTILHALQYFNISRPTLHKLLVQVNDLRKENDSRITAEVYDQVACDWLRANKDVYTKWIKREKIDLVIGGIFPMNSTGIAYQNIEKAAQMAEQAINNNPSILTNFTLSVQSSNGQCRPDLVMHHFIHYFNIQAPLLGILGPACSETVEPIAGISKHTRMTVISYAAEGASFTDRESYPYFFRTIGANRQYEAVYMKLFQQLKWRRIAALTEDGQKYTEYISHLETQMKLTNMELIINKKFPKDVSRMEIVRQLLDMKKKQTRIIIADLYNEVAQMIMCEAYRLEMTAKYGYIWFLPIWLSKSWIIDSDLEALRIVNCTVEELQTAVNGHFSLSQRPYAPVDSTMQENRTVGEWINDYSKQSQQESSDYAGFAYDAVWVYALAADKLFREDPRALYDFRSETVVNHFVELIWKTDLNGVSGRIRFDDGGSRITNIEIIQLVNGEFRILGQYVPEINEANWKIIGGNLELNESAIAWLTSNGEKPTDGTYICKVQGLADLLRTDCDNVTLILITLSCLFVMIFLSVFSFMFWKRRYDQKLKQSAKVMRNFGIDLLSPSLNMANTLDKWEIPKERVVINRRLGEGAFGTVYGGEAQLNDSGWTAVAVKTLKSGASTEDRLDFLSEAEAMKRFDHKNIIKLLGVCLQSEPIYTIMEFMLYGDLKTFLLARRHLVYEKTSEDSDISPKRLTMMSLDAVRGLSYLADMKYVHRDVACRNCLVNAQRVVKLGDFGMARPMFESDYYRFNRKGMLPVRWMAPESLALGVFTPSSDVWSFGVLLYEIITFGSFPYQGLTNNEVLEYIKNGKTLGIPTGIKPHLEGLMKACWSQDYKKRPSASEIVEYISNYPRLLTPCLDVPISSVEMPETESDQMELLPRGRKRVNSNQKTLDILMRSAAINNFDQNNSQPRPSSDSLLRVQNLNVPPDSTSNDDNSINTYSPMQPLLQCNPEVSNSNLSLKRYVPMYVIGKKNAAAAAAAAAGATVPTTAGLTPKNGPIDIESSDHDNTLL